MGKIEGPTCGKDDANDRNVAVHEQDVRAQEVVRVCVQDHQLDNVQKDCDRRVTLRHRIESAREAYREKQSSCLRSRKGPSSGEPANLY